MLCSNSHCVTLRILITRAIAIDDHDHVRGLAALLVAAAVAMTAMPAAGQSGHVAATQAPVAAASPLSVHVSLSKHRVRVGHRLQVTYSWTDGNGDLVDTNQIGTMAIHVLRNVPCTRTGKSAHPISGHGSWWYRPQAVFTGAFDHAVKIQVGFNVRTGGCASIEEKTATEIVTVLPAAG
jgi:hypothetical protein